MAINSPDRIGNKSLSDGLYIHMEDFKPASADGLNFGVRFLRDNVYGKQAALYHEAVLRGKRRVAAASQPMVDMEAIESIMDMWGIVDPYEAGKFYMSQIKTANKTISHVLDVAVPGWKQNYSLRHELTSPSENPSWALRWSARGQQKGQKQMVYEAQRQSLLAIASGSLHARTEKDRLGTVRADLQDAVLDIYSDPIEGVPHILLTEHDDETGKVVRVGDHRIGSAERTHLRRREYLARNIEGIGPVIVGDRQKGDPEMVLKMMVNAKNRLVLGGDGYLKPSDATDAFGMKLVVLEPGEKGYEDNMHRLQDIVVNQLISSDIPLDELKPDNGKSKNRGSSSHHDFLRLQARLRGVEVPYEVIIQSAPQMRNDEVMYGIPSQDVWKEHQYKAFMDETGVDLRGRLPDGTAHDLYKLRRYLFVLPDLFPSSIYGNNLVDHALDNLQQLDARLRKHDRLPDFDLSMFDVW